MKNNRSPNQTLDRAGGQSIRGFFEEYRAFAWAASLSSSPATVEGFREHLLLFSMKDQDCGGRDALLWLQERHQSALRDFIRDYLSSF